MCCGQMRKLLKVIALFAKCSWVGGALLCIASAAFSFSKLSGSLEVAFEPSGVTLPAAEREKFSQKLNRLRDQTWCPLEVALIEIGEPLRKDLSKRAVKLNEQRRDYLKALFVGNGVPEKTLHFVARRYPVSGVNNLPPGVVFAEFIGYRLMPCPYPAGPGGFHTYSN